MLMEGRGWRGRSGEGASGGLGLSGVCACLCERMQTHTCVSTCMHMRLCVQVCDGRCVSAVISVCTCAGGHACRVRG